MRRAHPDRPPPRRSISVMRRDIGARCSCRSRSPEDGCMPWRETAQAHGETIALWRQLIASIHVSGRRIPCDVRSSASDEATGPPLGAATPNGQAARPAVGRPYLPRRHQKVATRPSAVLQGRAMAGAGMTPDAVPPDILVESRANSSCPVPCSTADGLVATFWCSLVGGMGRPCTAGRASAQDVRLSGGRSWRGSRTRAAAPTKRTSSRSAIPGSCYEGWGNGWREEFRSTTLPGGTASGASLAPAIALFLAALLM